MAQDGRAVGWGRRLAWGIPLALGLSLIAGAIAMFVAGRCCVPAGSGLAGPGIVVGYGLLASLVGLAVGSILALRLSGPTLRTASLVLGAGGAVLAVALAAAVVRSKQESASALADAYARLPVFDITLTVTEGGPFQHFEADWTNRELRVTKRGAPVCRQPLEGKQAVRLLESLRAVEGVLLRATQPCVGSPGQPTHTLQFRIQEAQPPNTIGEFTASAECLAREPALSKAIDAARHAHRASGRCR